jgi:hypothetical protein
MAIQKTKRIFTAVEIEPAGYAARAASAAVQ